VTSLFDARADPLRDGYRGIVWVVWRRVGHGHIVPGASQDHRPVYRLADLRGSADGPILAGTCRWPETGGKP
jgi:hypothetical protein